MIAFFLAVVLLAPLSNANFTMDIEAEYGFSTNAEKQYSSGAANGLAVFLKQEGQIALFFEVISEETCLMQVHNILYSNDGSSNTFILHLNDKAIGEAVNKASNNNTYLLNQFISTGQVGEAAIIREGLYNLTITVETADEFGVEIDYVSVYMMHCSNITTNVSVVYNGNISYDHTNSTSCETDNQLYFFTICYVTLIAGCTTIFTITLIALFLLLHFHKPRVPNKQLQSTV